MLADFERGRDLRGFQCPDASSRDPLRNRDLIESFPRRHACADQDTNAEDYQEIIHRYISIESRDANVDAFRLLDDLVVSEFPITRDDVDTTQRISAEQHALSARDWLHLAVMERRGVDVTLSYDREFALRPGIDWIP